MSSNLTYPWVWLGFEEIYLRQSAQSTWQPLQQSLGTAQESVPWRMVVPVAGGERYLYRCGERLGLSDDSRLQTLYSWILTALLEELREPPLLFAPPAQLAGLAAVVRPLAPRLRGLLCDSVLFPQQALPEVRVSSEQEDAYIPDWSQPQQRIVRRFYAAQELRSGLLKPVLLSVQAYRESRTQEVLAYYLDDRQGVTPARIVLQAPPPLQQRQRPVGIGLVWAWGIGPRLWQWALLPRQLPAASSSTTAASNTWELELQSPWFYRITLSGVKEEGELIRPFIYEFYS